MIKKIMSKIPFSVKLAIVVSIMCISVLYFGDMFLFMINKLFGD